MNRKREGSTVVAAGHAACVGALAAWILAVCPLPATAAMYTNDTDWAGGNMTLANGDVIAGVHTNVGQFIVPAGATVTVHPYTNGPAFGRVTVYAQSASIAGNLRANAAGFGAGQGLGPGTGNSGGGYGGLGGQGTIGILGATYGDANNPTNLGSGGGTHPGWGTGGAGGGALILKVEGSVTNNGVVSANGGNGSDHGGGGSGGSILIKAASIEGAGTISADGGLRGNSSSGGGAGGRIAFDTSANSFTGTIQALGQPGK